MYVDSLVYYTVKEMDYIILYIIYDTIVNSCFYYLDN